MCCCTNKWTVLILKKVDNHKKGILPKAGSLFYGVQIVHTFFCCICSVLLSFVLRHAIK